MLKKIALISGVDGILKIVGFLLIPIYLAWMPKGEFGEFGYLYAAVSMLPAILTLGLYVPQIKESSASNDLSYRRKVFATTFLTVAILLATILTLLGVTGLYNEIVSHVFGVQINGGYKWLAFSVILFFAALNLVLYSHALIFQRATIIVKYNTLKFFLGNGVALAFIYIGLGYSDTSLDRLAGVALGEAFLFGITFIWLARSCWEWQIDFPYLNRALKLGLPIIPGSIAALITSLSDRYFITAYYDASYLAEYNLALQFLTPVQMIMIGAQTVWAPHVFSLKEGRDAHRQSINFLTKLSFAFLALIPLLILLVAFANKFNIIPPSYHDTIWLVPTLAFGVIEIVLLQIPFNLFIRGGKTSWVAYISILGAMLTVLCGALIIPRFGYLGGAISGGVINALLLVFAWRWTKQLNSIPRD